MASSAALPLLLAASVAGSAASAWSSCGETASIAPAVAAVDCSAGPTSGAAAATALTVRASPRMLPASSVPLGPWSARAETAAACVSDGRPPKVWRRAGTVLGDSVSAVAASTRWSAGRVGVEKTRVAWSTVT